MPESPRQTSAGEWRDHVIVCGLHDEGLRIVEQLQLAGAAAVVVDHDPTPRLVAVLERLGVPYLAADSRVPETLEAAGIQEAAALVCVESDDLDTLATALLARELRPGLRVVVQLRNEAVGRALEAVGVAVLDVARLTAPAIVAACLQTGRLSLWLGADEFVVVEADCGRSGSLRELYGDLTPVAVLRGHGEPVEVTPGRDVAVDVGDVVVLLGTPEALDSAGFGTRRPDTESTPFIGARAPRAQRVRRVSWLRQLAVGLERRVKIALLALGALVVVSIGVLMIGYREPDGARMSILDAAYFTAETISTVGYGDFSFSEQESWLRLWAISLMVVGAILVTAFYALLTNALVSRQLADTLGRRRITGLDDHVVLIGAGSIGVAVARRLREAGVDVVAVERDPDNRFLGVLRAQGVPIVAGDATVVDTWRELHLERARAVAVLTSDDLVNIETGLAVRDLLGDRWLEVPVVLRIFGRRLATTLNTSFDFHNVRSPAALAAPWFVGSALGMDVIETFYVGSRPLLVARLSVAAGSSLDGLAMQELSARVRVVSLVRTDGTVEHPPRRHTRFAAGESAYLIGAYEELLALLRSR
ncbi:hypothetical protein BH09ACT12_BH09ACT12_37150 [soil metagenome]